MPPEDSKNKLYSPPSGRGAIRLRQGGWAPKKPGRVGLYSPIFKTVLLSPPPFTHTLFRRDVSPGLVLDKMASRGVVYAWKEAGIPWHICRHCTVKMVTGWAKEGEVAETRSGDLKDLNLEPTSLVAGKS